MPRKPLLQGFRREIVCVAMSADERERLDSVCEKIGVTRSLFVRSAVNWLLANVDWEEVKPYEQNPGSDKRCRV